MAVIAHISDLHFGREITAVEEGLLHALTVAGPDLIIVSGDLTQRARHREYKRGVKFLRRLSSPYLIVPGNHDMSAFNLMERFFYPWRKWKQYIGPNMTPVMHVGDVTAIGINTARRTGWHLDWSRGSINALQRSFVARQLQELEDSTLRMLVAHHPFWLPAEFERRHLIDGRDAALNHLNQAGIDIVLSGHIHCAYSRLLQGVIISHTGTGISNRLMDGYPNSFNIIRGNRKGLEIELMEWHGERFVLSRAESYIRHDGEWRHS